MRPILTAADLQKVDEQLIVAQKISSFSLMERACGAFVAAFCSKITTDMPIWVVCGTGNNGGDGLGIALRLQQRGYTVSVALHGDRKTGSALFGKQLARWQQENDVHTLSEVPPPNGRVALIEALFGIGLNRPLDEACTAAIRRLHTWDALNISVDLPAGLGVDAPYSGHNLRSGLGH